ncbi:MAG: hypothetical protein R3A79_07890 [Nannocystaceae bacterium]
MRSTLVDVDPPVPATGVLIDLRNFTPSLNAAPLDARGTNQFCYFLAEFYAVSLELCTLALAPDEREAPPLSVNSTGDGLLVLFDGERHFLHGLLAAFLLESGLRRLCERRTATSPDMPAVSFGVGVESGTISWVRARQGSVGVDTFIGHCVNVAARVEQLTKLVANARVIIGDTTVERCAEALYGETFASLRARERAATSDELRIATQKRMNEINRDLCLTFLERYTLKGVDEPVPLYRLEEAAMVAGVARFERLLASLVGGNVRHLAEVRPRFACAATRE